MSLRDAWRERWRWCWRCRLVWVCLPAACGDEVGWDTAREGEADADADTDADADVDEDAVLDDRGSGSCCACGSAGADAGTDAEAPSTGPWAAALPSSPMPAEPTAPLSPRSVSDAGGGGGMLSTLSRGASSDHVGMLSVEEIVEEGFGGALEDLRDATT